MLIDKSKIPFDDLFSEFLNKNKKQSKVLRVEDVFHNIKDLDLLIEENMSVKNLNYKCKEKNVKSYFMEALNTIVFNIWSPLMLILLIKPFIPVEGLVISTFEKWLFSLFNITVVFCIIAVVMFKKKNQDKEKNLKIKILAIKNDIKKHENDALKIKNKILDILKTQNLYINIKVEKIIDMNKCNLNAGRKYNLEKIGYDLEKLVEKIY